MFYLKKAFLNDFNSIYRAFWFRKNDFGGKCQTSAASK
jgi:hypothetical protein